MNKQNMQHINHEKKGQPAESAEPQKDQPRSEKAPSDLQRELADYKDKYVRLLAEFENARKRNERERIEFIKYANEGIIQDFLGTLDDLERTVQAAKASHEDYAAFLKGIEMVMGRVHDLLKKHNVQPMRSVGEKFDPHRHEILMLADSDQYQEGIVIEEFQKGYLLGDKVVRTAKVKVAKPKSSAPQSASKTEVSPAQQAQEQPPSPS